MPCCSNCGRNSTPDADDDSWGPGKRGPSYPCSVPSERQITVGNVKIGCGAPVVVQSMTTTPTHDVEATTAQIAALASAGCEIVRCAVPKTEDAEALKRIVRLSPIPVIADIHFNASLALKAIDAGVAAVRINPGNIGGPRKGEQVVIPAERAGLPIGIGALLADGIGDTLRVSLTADPVQEVEVAWEILKALGLRERGPIMIACPSCGRDNVGVQTLAEKVEARLKTYPQAFEVAVMGCAVNGPGEAGDADFGIAGGRDVGFIYAHGRTLKKVSSDILIDELFFEIDRWIEDGMKRPKRLKMAKPAALAMAEASLIPLGD